MKLISVKERLPDKVGNYWCTIDSEDFLNPTRIHTLKQICWFGESGKFYTSFSSQKVISWIDEKEEDQDILWDEIVNIFSPYTTATNDFLIGVLKPVFASKYTISRK